MNNTIVFWRMWKLLQFSVSVPVIAAIDELGEWQVFSFEYLAPLFIMIKAKIYFIVYC